MVLAEQIDQTKFVFNIANASNISYITIFILPNSPFVDNNYTALIYFQLPQSGGSSPEYKLLGGINPNKPSAIYKLNNNTNKGSKTVDDIDMDMNDGGPIDLSGIKYRVIEYFCLEMKNICKFVNTQSMTKLYNSWCDV